MPELRKYTVFLTIIALNGCAVTSDGPVVLGGKGSAAWNRMATPQEIAAYYDTLSTAQLCQQQRDPIRTDDVLLRPHTGEAPTRRAVPVPFR